MGFANWQSVYLAGLAQQRGELQQKIRDLSEDRDGYLAKKVEEAGGLEDSLDRQLYKAEENSSKLHPR